MTKTPEIPIIETVAEAVTEIVIEAVIVAVMVEAIMTLKIEAEVRIVMIVENQKSTTISVVRMIIY